MPKLSEMIGTKELVLPVSGAKVVVLDVIPFEKAQEIRTAATDETNKVKVGAIAAACIIQSWDITDDQDEILAVTEEVFKSMPDKDVQAIATYAISLVTEQPVENKPTE